MSQILIGKDTNSLTGEEIPISMILGTEQNLFNVWYWSLAASDLGTLSKQDHTIEKDKINDVTCGKWLSVMLDLRKMRHLNDNWNGLGSAPPNSHAIWNAQDVISILHKVDFAPSQISPSAEEGVGISFVKGDKYAIIECYNDGDIAVAFSDGQGKTDIWEIGTSNSEIKETIDRLVAYLDE